MKSIEEEKSEDSEEKSIEEEKGIEEEKSEDSTVLKKSHLLEIPRCSPGLSPGNHLARAAFEILKTLKTLKTKTSPQRNQLTRSAFNTQKAK